MAGGGTVCQNAGCRMVCKVLQTQAFLNFIYQADAADATLHLIVQLASRIDKFQPLNMPGITKIFQPLVTLSIIDA